MTEEGRINIPPEELIPSLASESQASRRYAAKMLGITEPEQLGPFLLEAMERATVPVRQAVSETLGRLHGISRNQVFGTETERLADLPYLPCLLLGIKEPDETTRVSSARSLGNLWGKKEAVDVLVQALSGPSAQVRAEAARSLGRHGDAQAAPSLILALSDAEPRVREQAAAALECIRVEDARAPLLELLEDEDKDVRTRAALALGALGAPDAIPQLMEIVQFAYWQHRPSAATYLCRMKAEEALPVLTRALGEHEKGLNRTVARGLGILGSRNAVPELIRYLGYGGDRKYRIDLIEALGELGDRSAVPAISDALHRWGDAAAVPVLLQLGGREAEDAVIRQVNDGYHIRAAASAAWRLGAAGSTRAMPALRQAVEEADSMYLVRGAGEALAMLGDTISGPDMVEWLRHADQDKRRRAAIALAYLGDASAIGPLMEALRDQHREVRREAALSLGLRSGQTAIPALTAALDDIDEEVRKEARRALALLAKKEQAC